MSFSLLKAQLIDYSRQAFLMVGFLLINKPVGITSYDVIRAVKKMLPPKTKIGHSGTLDPFASGLLILGIGRQYTKQLTQCLNGSKRYRAEMTFGFTTDSYDVDGEVTYSHPSSVVLELSNLLPVLNSFKGTISQMPPAFSAKKSMVAQPIIMPVRGVS